MEDRGVFNTRSWEWELLDPLVGCSMLELGNKVKGGQTYKEFFISRGFRHVSVDTNGLNGALPLDLTRPLHLGCFDMVTNIGTSEHVSEDDYAGQIECWRNMLEALDIGSVLICCTPKPGSWPRHGTWYPTEAFYDSLSRVNGLELERLYDSDQRKPNCPPQLRLIFARMTRREYAPFVMPPSGMFHNIK